MSQPNETINFTRAIPASEALMPASQFKELAAAAIDRGAATIQSYGSKAGYPALRSQLAAEYKVSEDQILVGGEGSVQLLDFISRDAKNSLVFVEQPTYDRAITIFRRNGARVVGIPLEDDGISVGQLEAAIASLGVPRFVYLVPDSQNPTGVTLSLAKRQEIVALANQHDFTIIEDIPYRHLRYSGEPHPMLRELDDHHVITLSSFSKLIAPGLRVAYVVAPAKVVADLVQLAEDTYISPPHLSQAIVSEFLERGLLDDQITRLIDLYAPRWKAALESAKVLGGNVYEADGGFVLGVELAREAKVDRLVERAVVAGVAISAGQPFYADALDGTEIYPHRFLRLPFCALTEAEFAEGMRRLAAIL